MNRQVVGGSLIGLGVIIAMLMLLSRGLGIPFGYIAQSIRGTSSQPKSATNVRAKTSKPPTQPRNSKHATPKLSHPNPSPKPRPVVDGMW